MLRLARVGPALFALVLGFGAAAALVAQARATGGVEISAMVTLAELKDHARPLLIFAPDAKDIRLLDQEGVIRANQKDARERQLVAVAVPERGDVSVGRRLAPDEAAEARRRFHVKAGEFAVVLIGKDGGEKLRSGKPLPFKRLEDVIDAMPMRQEESGHAGF